MLFQTVSRLFIETESLINHLIQSFNFSNEEPTKQKKNTTTNNKTMSQGFVKPTQDHPSGNAGGKTTGMCVDLLCFVFISFLFGAGGGGQAKIELRNKKGFIGCNIINIFLTHYENLLAR